MTKVHEALGDRFRHHFKRLRTRQNLSQAALAAVMGIDRQYVYQLEAGLRHPSMEMIEKAARAFDVDVSVLLKEIP